jgi:hypothetical protein
VDLVQQVCVAVDQKCASARHLDRRTRPPSDPEDDDRHKVRETADRAEPRVPRAAVSSREFDHERHDDRDDHGEPGERGGVDVDLAEALVPPLAAQPADRLAAPAEQDQRPERGHDPQRHEPASGIVADPLRCEHDESESDRKQRRTISI